MRQLLNLSDLSRLDVSDQDAARSLHLSNCFTHNMVIQRDTRVAIWGTAAPNLEVKVKFQGQEKTTTTASNGHWQLFLDPINACLIGNTMVVSTDFQEIYLDNVVVGEVWVCSGQSNMGWTLNLSADAEKHIKQAVNPMVRFLVVPTHRADNPEQDIQPSRWEQSHPDHARHWSAVGFHFATRLFESLGVPIGIIWASLGATKIEEWTSEEINQLHDYEVPEEWNHNQPSSLFNGMIAPVIPFTIKGMAWYQGEENHWGAGLYQTQFSAMIEDWRERWQQGSFPVVFTQLANYGQTNTQPWSAWAELQEAQLFSLDHPNTAMAVAIDVGEANDIHPQKKQPVGERLALAALGKFYRLIDVYSGPIFKSAKLEGSKFRIEFEHTGEGLSTSDGLAPNWFEVAEPHPLGDAKNPLYFPAKAQIDGHSVIVWHDELKHPSGVRYAFNNNPEGCNLVNSANLPASPFRSNNDWSATLGNNPKRTIQQKPVALHMQVSTKTKQALSITLKGMWSRRNRHKQEIIEIIDPPQHGNLRGSPPFLVYQPESLDAKMDSFTYRVRDENAASNIASVIIDISSEPDAIANLIKPTAMAPQDVKYQIRTPAIPENSLVLSE